MEHVALALDDRYLRLVREPGQRLPRLRLGESVVDDDAVFQRLALGHGRIALRQEGLGYLAVRPDAGLSYAVYPVPELTAAAAFEEILWPSGHVSLRSCHLTYVSADPAGRVTVNRTEAGARERFLMGVVPVPTLLAQDLAAAPGPSARR